MAKSDIQKKAEFQFRGELMKILEPLKRYGQGEYCDMILTPITELALQLHKRLDGEDIPIVIKRPTYTP